MLISRNSVCLGIAQSEVRNVTERKEFPRKKYVWRNSQNNNNKGGGGCLSPSPTTSGQTVVQGRLSLNVCPHHFIFHGMVWNEITKFRVICFFKKWFGTEFRTFCLPRNGLERNSERFSFRERDGISTEWIKISVCSVFRGIFFSRKIATLGTALQDW